MADDSSSAPPLVLAINAGSSSLKASLIQQEVHVANFLAERLQTDQAVLHIEVHDQPSSSKSSVSLPNGGTHAQALQEIWNFLQQHHPEWWTHLAATGHRVVHGGTLFQDAVVVTAAVLSQIQSVSHLAPLHNPHNVAGIQVCLETLPQLPAVAVFDTAFHATIPAMARTYPIPLEYRQAGICKYGFHGTSVHYVTLQATQIIKTVLREQQPDSPRAENMHYRLIVCHLGNGASVTAVEDGRSVETSMGFTPTSGLMMGTRSGSIDPAVVSFACHTFNKTVDEVMKDLNQESGLKAMTASHDYDMRSLLKQAAAGDADAQLDIDMFVYRIAQHVASSAVALSGPVDALVFTAGIGEHSAEIRRRVVQQLYAVLPLELDPDRNQHDGKDSMGVITKAGAWPIALDIATDEEVMIARECLRLTASLEN